MGIIRVLVIEDNPSDVRLIREGLTELTEHEFEILHAKRLSSGLRFILAGRIDIVLLDLNLPDSIGIDALKRILEACPNVPVVVLTGLEDEILGLQLMRQGAQDYLVKGQTGGRRLARSLLFAIERKRTEDALIRSAELQSMLREIAEASLFSSSLHELYAKVYRLAGKVLPAKNFFIALRDETAGQITVPFSADGMKAIPRRRPAGNGLTEYIMRLGHALHLSHAELDRLFASGEVSDLHLNPVNEWLGAPLADSRGKAFGVIALFSNEVTQQFHKSDCEVLSIIAAQISLSIERKMSEETVRKLSVAVEQSPAAVVITDLSGNITYVNRKFTEVSGYEYAEALGQNPRILKTEETPPEVFADLWRTIKAGGVWQGEFVNRKKNGEHYWERALINPILDADGIITHFLAIKEDITEFKRNQLALQLAKEEAESANRMKSAFVAHMSHEIRTPMNAILGFTEILLRDEALTGSQRQHLETIGRSSEHLLELINDVLEMSKIESGRSSLNQAEFYVRQVLDDVAGMFRAKSDEKSIRLSMETDPDVPVSIFADKQKFRQILINLVGNAIKFTMEGQVAVRMRTQPEGGIPGRLRLFLDVSDSGPGIRHEEIGSLFRMFSQTAEGAGSGGTGLGLAISRNFARMMGGDIIVTSQLGIGSCFHVEILAEEGRGDLKDLVQERTISGLAPGQKSCRILIVDDEEVNCRLISHILEKVGFETRQAADGEAAITVFVRWEPDIVLMDCQMPNMDGYEATRRLKALRPVSVIGVSAGVFETDRKNALDCGMDAFVVKPFKARELLDLVADFLHLRYLYDELPEPKILAGPEPASFEEELEKLPFELVEQIHFSAGSADYYELMKWIDEAGHFSIMLANHLRSLARRFDYEACIAIAERKMR